MESEPKPPNHLPAVINLEQHRDKPWLWKPGKSANPAGKRKGTKSRRTTEARLVCQELVDDPAYRCALRQRLIDGTAGAMEALVWMYGKGKPREQSSDLDADNALKQLTNEQLRERLAAALDKL
jgi:hypothetical protein